MYSQQIFLLTVLRFDVSVKNKTDFLSILITYKFLAFIVAIRQGRA